MNVNLCPGLREKFRAGRPLALDLCAKQAAAEVLAEHVIPIQKQLLQGFDLRADPFPDMDGHKIEDPEQLYLCADNAGCQAFYDACDVALRAAGLKPADMPAEYCPLLVAKHDRLKAERKVIEYAARALMAAGWAEEFNPDRLWGEKRQRFIELAMGLILNA